jgi:hypothetical protein
VQFYCLIEKALYPLGFAAAQMAFGSFDPHNLTAAGNMEAALGPFMGF